MLISNGKNTILALAALAGSFAGDYYGREGGYTGKRKSRKAPLTASQRKVRAKNKLARKARKRK